MTDIGHELTAGPAPADAGEAQVRRLQPQLRRLHILIGDQFAAAVTDERLDIDVANGMLEVFGMPGSAATLAGPHRPAHGLRGHRRQRTRCIRRRR